MNNNIEIIMDEKVRETMEHFATAANALAEALLLASDVMIIFGKALEELKLTDNVAESEEPDIEKLNGEGI